MDKHLATGTLWSVLFGIGRQHAWFWLRGPCAWKPSWHPIRTASHVLVTSLWQTVYFTFWSLEKTIWQNNEKVFVHLGSWETSLVPINSLLQPSGRIFNKPLGVKYLCFLWNKSSKSNQNNQNLRLEAYGVYNFTELHKPYMLFFLKRAQESGFFFPT